MNEETQILVLIVSFLERAMGTYWCCESSNPKLQSVKAIHMNVTYAIQHPVLKTSPRKSSRKQKNATLVLHETP